MSNRNSETRFERPEQVIPWMIQQWVRENVNTSGPGIVRAYDARRKRAQVQPALRRLLAGDTPDAAPVPLDLMPILNVPVLHPGGGEFLLHSPLRDGDPVWLNFSQRGLDAFKATYALADPPLGMFFDMRDAVALLGFGALDFTPASATGMAWQTNDAATSIVMETEALTLRARQITFRADNIDDRAY